MFCTFFINGVGVFRRIVVVLLLSGIGFSVEAVRFRAELGVRLGVGDLIVRDERRDGLDVAGVL